MKTRRERILDTVSYLARQFPYYEDEDLPYGTVEAALEAGEITQAEILCQFADCCGFDRVTVYGSQEATMPDITMCKGHGCKRKDQCYRFIAEPSEFRQSFFTEPPVLPDGSCRHFWDVTITRYGEPS